MRIISPFHDYYDTAQGLGFDPLLTYRREVEKKVVSMDRLDPVIHELCTMSKHGWDFEPKFIIIGFCGRLYPAYVIPEFRMDGEALTSRPASRVVMTVEELDACKDERYDHRDNKWSRAAKARRWGALKQQGTVVSPETFRLLGAPIWLAEPCDWRWNGPSSMTIHTNVRLANFDFQKHFDAYSAYQEIAMYLGSILAASDDSARTVGNDEVIARAKGFGPESFRSSAPSVKKSRRRENRARKKGEGSS